MVFYPFRPRNPDFGIYGKAWKIGLSLGPSDPGFRLWVAVKPERWWIDLHFRPRNIGFGITLNPREYVSV